MSLSPGVRLGPYEILSPLGAGGMGEVWRARDTRVDRAVALKVLPEEFFESEERRQRFGREARMLASLNHPGIATLYSFEENGGRHLLTMELVEGETLARRLASRPLGLEESLPLACQIAAALEAAHAKGIVHRDLKPGNVMVAADGRVKLLDFGLAKALGEEVAPADVSHSPTLTAAGTEAGVILGTAAYMSPEQARGQRVDARADVWAFGVVLYEMLAGGRLFRGEGTADTLAAVLREPVDFKKLPASTPRDVRDLLARCLERDPGKRLATIGDARRVLEKAEAGGGLTRAVGLRLAIVAVLLLVAAAGGVFLARRKPASPAPQASLVPSIAVLPFANLSGDKEQEYFSDGLTEEVMGLLTRIRDLKVTGRTSSFAFKGKSDDLKTIGQKLNVATVLEGSVRRSGDRLRVSTRLVKASDGYQLWAETYDRKMTDVFAVQDEIAGAVVAALKVKLLTGEAGGKAKRHTPKPGVYEQFLLARDLLVRGEMADAHRVREILRRVVEVDPAYPEAHAALAVAEWNIADIGKTPEQIAEGRQSALSIVERAIALDPELAYSYAMRGWFRISLWDWAGAGRDVDRASVLDPGGVDPQLLRAGLLRAQGRRSETIAAGRRIVAVDPLSPEGWGLLANGLMEDGQFEEARKAMARVIELSSDPEHTSFHFGLGMISLLEGDPGSALAEFQRVGSEVYRFTGTAIAQKALGREAEAQRALDSLIAGYAVSSAFQIAMVYGRFGERDKAFEWLDRAFAQRDAGFQALASDMFFFESLRSDPRFAALLKKLNLPVSS